MIERAGSSHLKTNDLGRFDHAGLHKDRSSTERTVGGLPRSSPGTARDLNLDRRNRSKCAEKGRRRNDVTKKDLGKKQKTAGGNRTG